MLDQMATLRIFRCGGIVFHLEMCGSSKIECYYKLSNATLSCLDYLIFTQQH